MKSGNAWPAVSFRQACMQMAREPVQNQDHPVNRGGRIYASRLKAADSSIGIITYGHISKETVIVPL